LIFSCEIGGFALFAERLIEKIALFVNRQENYEHISQNVKLFHYSTAPNSSNVPQLVGTKVKELQL